MEKYAVDRIEGEYAILENIVTKDIKQIELAILPVVKEKDILVYQNNLYMIDNKERRKRMNLIKKKLEKLKNIK